MRQVLFFLLIVSVSCDLSQKAGKVLEATENIIKCLYNKTMSKDQSYERKLTNAEHFRNSHDYMNDNQWQCGGGDWESTSKSVNFCSDKYSEMNMCCSVHDDCYGLQRGQLNCDEAFAKCLNKTLEWHTSGRMCSLLGDKWVLGATVAVCAQGSEYYIPATGNESRRIESYAPALNKTVERNYMQLYDKCQFMNTTFSSCAYNHMICYMRLLSDRSPQNYEDCVDNLIICLDESTEFLAPDNEPCLTQVEITMKSIAENSRESGIPTIRDAVEPKNGYKRIRDSGETLLRKQEFDYFPSQ